VRKEMPDLRIWHRFSHAVLLMRLHDRMLGVDSAVTKNWQYSRNSLL
jgi:hypothetical protein